MCAKQTKNCAEFTSTVSAAEDKEEEINSARREKKKQKTVLIRNVENKKMQQVFSLCLHRVFMVQHLSSFIEMSHADFMVHLKDD